MVLDTRHPRKGYFCGVFPLTDAVKLCFENGRLLSDPEELLEGHGKKVRYVIFRDTDDLRNASIKKLLIASINL